MLARRGRSWPARAISKLPAGRARPFADHPRGRGSSVAALATRRRIVATAALAPIAVLATSVAGAGGGAAPVASRAATSAVTTRRHRAHHARHSLASEQSRAIDRLLRRQPFIISGGRARREIALTFDDGPGPYTPRVLAVLRAMHVPATFFVIGEMQRYFSASTVAERRAGDTIGDHTATHPFMAHLSGATQDQEIIDTIGRLGSLGVPYPRLYRPPYGSFDHATFVDLARHHMLMVLWSTDTQDYRRPGTRAILRAALAGAKPGAIILMHDGGGTRTQTIAALPLIIRALRARRYRLVSVPRLILDDPPPRGQRLAPGLVGD